MRGIEPIGRTWRTLRHLKTGQIAALIHRRLVPLTPVAPPAAGEVHRRNGVALLPRPCTARLQTDHGWTFDFLGLARTYTPASLDWHPADVPRLWRYNLHYFDYLLVDGCLLDARDALIDRWIEANPPGTRDAWEPYPTSLRIVNWIDHFLRTEGERPLKDAWLRSLAHQAAWLERNLEYHLLANHLLKNAVALVFAGAFFEGAAAERWRRLGTRLLAREVREQFLADGGHFERSPMYHAIATQDLLDVANLLRRSPGLRGGALAPLVEDTALAALGFLADVCHPDGEIALFNDAAFGIAPPPAELRGYAERVLGRSIPWHLDPEAIVLIDRPHTGYFGCRNGGDYLIVDCGPIGPDYQPGHAHCDTLSFELSIAGRRVIVDSGVCGYEDDALRRYVRSTAAHNTVRFNGEEQSEVWLGFRVGRRARPLLAKIEKFGSDGVLFRGAHDGFSSLTSRAIHHREIRYSAAGGTWSINDRVEGGTAVTVESFIHFAPDLRVAESGEFYIATLAAGAPIAEIGATGRHTFDLVRTPCCHCFGAAAEKIGLICRAKADTLFDFGYAIRKRS